MSKGMPTQIHFSWLVFFNWFKKSTLVKKIRAEESFRYLPKSLHPPLPTAEMHFYQFLVYPSSVSLCKYKQIHLHIFISPPFSYKGYHTLYTILHLASFTWQWTSFLIRTQIFVIPCWPCHSTPLDTPPFSNPLTDRGIVPVLHTKLQR